MPLLNNNERDLRLVVRGKRRTRYLYALQLLVQDLK